MPERRRRKRTRPSPEGRVTVLGCSKLVVNFYSGFAVAQKLLLTSSSSLAWAEMYIVISALVQRFDFKFDGAGPKDVIAHCDEFIIGTQDRSGIKAFVTKRKS